MEEYRCLFEELSKETQEEYYKQAEVSVYPFNKHELFFSVLLANQKLTLSEYYKIRQQHLKQNKYLHIFEISAPTDFGELWAEKHIQEIVPELVKPKKNNTENYKGEYDFLLQSKIKIEVKASRATDRKKKGPLYTKALASTSGEKFDMNFQQIKPDCCDVFVWIGVWKDLIRYWIIDSNSVAKNKYFSDKQHRGNVGEGQLHIKNDNIDFFSQYEAEPSNLRESILKAYTKQYEC